MINLSYICYTIRCNSRNTRKFSKFSSANKVGPVKNKLSVVCKILNRQILLWKKPIYLSKSQKIDVHYRLDDSFNSQSNLNEDINNGNRN